MSLVLIFFALRSGRAGLRERAIFWARSITIFSVGGKVLHRLEATAFSKI